LRRGGCLLKKNGCRKERPVISFRVRSGSARSVSGELKKRVRKEQKEGEVFYPALSSGRLSKGGSLVDAKAEGGSSETRRRISLD